MAPERPVWSLVFTASACTVAAVIGLLFLLLVLRRPEHRQRTWWFSPSPVCKPGTQALAFLLSVSLIGVAWGAQAFELRQLDCASGRIDSLEDALRFCSFSRTDRWSFLSDQIDSCRRAPSESPKCIDDLRKVRQAFNVLGFSVDLATTRYLIVVLYSGALLMLSAIQRSGETAETALGSLLERRIVRVGYLIASGWTTSYLMGYTPVFASSTVAIPATVVSGALICASAGIVAARVPHWLSLSWLIGCIIFTGLAGTGIPRLLVAISAAACTVSQVILELLQGGAHGKLSGRATLHGLGRALARRARCRRPAQLGEQRKRISGAA